MIWDKVVHCVDPEMDIGSCTLSKTSDLVCFGNGTLGGRSLDRKALGENPDKALEDDPGKALGPEYLLRRKMGRIMRILKMVRRNLARKTWFDRFGFFLF